MKEHEQYAQVDMTFSQMEGAIESFVETAHLAGLNVDDLLALLDAGLNIKEIIELIGVKGSSPARLISFGTRGVTHANSLGAALCARSLNRNRRRK